MRIVDVIINTCKKDELLDPMFVENTPHYQAVLEKIYGVNDIDKVNDKDDLLSKIRQTFQRSDTTILETAYKKKMDFEKTNTEKTTDEKVDVNVTKPEDKKKQSEEPKEKRSK